LEASPKVVKSIAVNQAAMGGSGTKWLGLAFIIRTAATDLSELNGSAQ
jgi:hypothetical protein